MLAGGDDYELCFTAPAARHGEILALSQPLGLAISCIGRIGATPGLSVKHHGEALAISARGFDHFAA